MACMDTSFDQPTFDIQSMYLSFQERRWIHQQRQLHKLDDLLQPLDNLHKSIRDAQQFSLLPTTLSSSAMVPQVSLYDQLPLYYTTAAVGLTDRNIDQFRFYNQLLFQLTFADVCSNKNYRLLTILLEGLIFSSSQTPQEYSASMTHEMRKCLTSFELFIRTRVSKLLAIISLVNLSTLPLYIYVSFKNNQNQNTNGILFQMLPKIRYTQHATTLCNSIVVVDQYINHHISPEELRYADYMIHMKSKRYPGATLPQTKNGVGPSRFSFPVALTANNPAFGLSQTPQILHSLPIHYPYDEKMIYGQKYPSFWKGTKHTDETNSTLFESIAIETNTPEYTFVHRLFTQTVSESQIKIVVIERIQNPHLWEKFCVHRSYMRRKNGNENLNEQWLFHGTKSDNHHQIISHGFNRSYCHDKVLYGRGVYFARHASYSCLYSDRQDLSFLFLCRVLVGRHTVGSNDIRVPPHIQLANGQKVQSDSTTNLQDSYSIVCTFHDDQNYPEYIITYTNQSDGN